ncbi:protein decapentaplegic-like [Stylophora pistillata]|uniref:protein decapentaplegic-like n=1 Tax=Stylophora pistillata TaxID=50429 RepID=UPI000C03F9A6|nr:protein decapentaplegic-like [Stylophora pistillata]
MVKHYDSQPSSVSSENLVLYNLYTKESVRAVKMRRRGDMSWALPVLALVKRWMRSPLVNRGSYFRLQPFNVEHLVYRKDTPLLVVQTQAKLPEIDSMSIGNRTLAGVKQKSRHAREIRDKGPCSVRPMRILMGRNVLGKGVILPKFYDAYRCGGDCKFPLSNKVNPTNYAIIRSLLYSSGHDQGSGEPCCVPIKLRGLSTIEYREDDFRMEFYKNMIVEECGCR